MKETLDQLTVAEFIELVCGDTSVLHDRNETVSPTNLAIAMRNIVFEYREIADLAGVKSYLSEIEELIKAKISVVIFTMCNNLVILKEHNRVREVLTEYGIKTESMTDTRVEAEVTSRLERAKSTVSRIEKENQNETQKTLNIRRACDEQTATLMAYFKFQIDTSEMKATIYAHLIARHNKEIKAQRAAMKKK